MAIETMRYDSAEFLDTLEAQAEYLAAAFETGDDKLVKKSLATVARARGMTAIAKDADLSRQALYKSLIGNADPRLSTVLSVMKALGMRVSVQLEKPTQ